MASPELDWVIAKVASDRGQAGVCEHFFDVTSMRNALPATELPLPDTIKVEYVSASGVPCYWLASSDADPDRRIVYCHGGGFVAGGFHSHRTLAGWLAEATKASVLFVEYRLAPEHRFPAAIDDVDAALAWIWENGPGGHSEPARTVAIGGDSAGAALAVAGMLRARQRGSRLPHAGFLLCGMLDLDEETSDFLKLTQRSRDGTRLYVKNLRDLRSEFASPILADPHDLPPLLIQTGTSDYCRNDSIRFAERAQKAGVGVTLEVWPDMVHVWQRFAPKLPEALQSLQRVGAYLADVESRL
jgi:epsilon-lactone hydrolase